MTLETIWVVSVCEAEGCCIVDFNGNTFYFWRRECQMECDRLKTLSGGGPVEYRPMKFIQEEKNESSK